MRGGTRKKLGLGSECLGWAADWAVSEPKQVSWGRMTLKGCIKDHSTSFRGVDGGGWGEEKGLEKGERLWREGGPP